MEELTRRGGKREETTQSSSSEGSSQKRSVTKLRMSRARPVTMLAMRVRMLRQRGRLILRARSSKTEQEADTKRNLY